MAKGDKSDIIGRLQRWLPAGWFPTDVGTRIYATIAGFASSFNTVWLQIAYVSLQTRIATTTDGFLDLASRDFFGANLPRLSAESDINFSLRIRNEVLRDRTTRNAIDQILFQITGKHPIIIELERPMDTGAYRYYRGYGVSGRYASKSWRYAVFIITQHAGRFAIPNANGWRGYNGGYRSAPSVWADPSMLTGTGFTDAQIYEALNRIRAAGVTYWVRIT